MFLNLFLTEPTKTRIHQFYMMIVMSFIKTLLWKC